MQNNENNSIVKVNAGLARVNQQITATKKLLEKIDPVLIPYRKKDKWGFCTKDKEIVIDCIYEKVQQFKDGLAAVHLKGKWGFINKFGSSVIPCVYQQVPRHGGYLHFKDGYKNAQFNGKCGIINELGEVVIPFIYDYVDDFYEGLAEVGLNRKYGFVDKSGE